jgi:peptidylprolyl isomerase
MLKQGETMPINKRTFIAGLAGLATGTTLLVTGRAATQEAPEIAPPPLDPKNTVYLDLPSGRVVIRLRPDLAPKHVERVKLLCREGFYDGTPFHRVIEGFMAQGGDPTGTGEGGSKYPNLPAEFSTSAHFLRGTVGAARAADPDSANSQFFIMFAPGPGLDGNYTIWGNVVSGMEFVDKIKRGDPDNNGKVDAPDRIVHMRVAADVK